MRLPAAGAEKATAHGGEPLADRDDLLGSLAFAEHHFLVPLAQGAVVVDASEGEVFVRQMTQPVERRVRSQASGGDFGEEGAELLARSRHVGDRVEVLEEDRLRLGHGFDLEEPLAEVAGPVQSLGVPAEVLPELDHGLAGVALESERQSACASATWNRSYGVRQAAG